MFDFGCHRIEVLANVFGQITKVKALTANVIFERDVEDTAAALFQFAGGACAALSVTHAVSEPQDTLDIFGRHGSIHIPVLNEGAMRIVTREVERWERHPPDANLHAPLISDFVDAVLNNHEPAVTGETGRMVAMVEEKVYAEGGVSFTL